jgi:hypothetical protein
MAKKFWVKQQKDFTTLLMTEELGIREAKRHFVKAVQAPLLHLSLIL